jgi:hypothetical protein
MTDPAHSACPMTLQSPEQAGAPLLLGGPTLDDDASADVDTATLDDDAAADEEEPKLEDDASADEDVAALEDGASADEGAPALEDDASTDEGTPTIEDEAAADDATTDVDATRLEAGKSLLDEPLNDDPPPLLPLLEELRPDDDPPSVHAQPNAPTASTDNHRLMTHLAWVNAGVAEHTASARGSAPAGGTTTRTLPPALRPSPRHGRPLLRAVSWGRDAR